MPYNALRKAIPRLTTKLQKPSPENFYNVDYLTHWNVLRKPSKDQKDWCNLVGSILPNLMGQCWWQLSCEQRYKLRYYWVTHVAHGTSSFLEVFESLVLSHRLLSVIDCSYKIPGVSKNNTEWWAISQQTGIRVWTYRSFKNITIPQNYFVDSLIISNCRCLATELAYILDKARVAPVI